MPKRHRRKEHAEASLPPLRYEDAFLFLWNVIVVPRYLPFMRALGRGFDQIGLIGTFTTGERTATLPWYAGAVISFPLLAAFFTRNDVERSELVSGIPRLAVGPALYFFLVATFHAAPDGPLAAALAFLTMIVVGISGMMARDGGSPIVSPPVRRWLVFPAIVAGATYVNVAVTTGLIREFTAGSSAAMNIVGSILIVLFASVAYFFGVIAPRTLAGDVARPLHWALRFGVYAASLAAGTFL
jgi:hypothetical protein